MAQGSGEASEPVVLELSGCWVTLTFACNRRRFFSHFSCHSVCHWGQVEIDLLSCVAKGNQSIHMVKLLLQRLLLRFQFQQTPGICNADSDETSRVFANSAQSPRRNGTIPLSSRAQWSHSRPSNSFMPQALAIILVNLLGP